MDYELAIIGAGPAGYSAAIYAVRSGVKTALFDRGDGGGRAVLSPNVENYAGFESIPGAELMEKIKHHAGRYVQPHLYEEVTSVGKQGKGFLVKTAKGSYVVGAVLFCTGSEHKTMGIPGEQEFLGKGVSYCATCDGFFFRGKSVAVVGGGSTAVMEAVFLKQIGCKDVFLVHRREQLRAEQAYVTEAREKQVKILLNKEVERIEGESVVKGMALRDAETRQASKLAVDGVFISIGWVPQNEVVKRLGVEMDAEGYVVVNRFGCTGVPGVYAAGDLTGGVRQIVTACASGAVAALSSLEALGKKYPF
jgi:thioredoxin reductase (NADPH)